MLRADLHVHSRYSGLNRDLAFLRSLDCYNEPDAVYDTARRRGMDLVTITDHDSIDGCLAFLDRHPDARDFIVGEEITCSWPGAPLEVHVAAYGIGERHHRALQPLRRSVHDVVSYLREEGVFTVVNHPFHYYRGQVPLDDYVALLCATGGLEARNGTMLPAHNEVAERLAQRLQEGGVVLGRTAGSDAHTLRRIGRTWTEAPGRTADEFLASLRAGRGRAGGADSSTLGLAADVYGVVIDYWRSLAGFTGHRYSTPRRALGIGFSAVSLPFQFTPALVAVVQKTREAARCRALAKHVERPGQNP